MRKLFYPLMVLTLLLTLLLATGCQAQGTDGSTRDLVPVPAGEWYTPFETTVNITAVAPITSGLLFDGDDSFDYNPWTRLFRDRLNIEVEYLWTMPAGADFEDRLNMAIAAGEIPDVLDVNFVQFRQLLEAGLLLDLTDYYHNYTSDRIRSFSDRSPGTLNTVTVDGRIMGIPNYYFGVIDQPRTMWLRNDWYQEWRAGGGPELLSVAQFEDFMRWTMDEKGAEYGIALENLLTWLFYTGPMFGVYLGNPGGPFAGGTHFWYPDATGRLVPGEAHPEFMTALTYWARWFQEGFISPDFAAIDAARGEEDIVAGRVGTQPWLQWNGWVNSPHLVALWGEDAYQIPIPFPTISGVDLVGQAFFASGTITVVSRDFQNPAALMKMISLSDDILFSLDSELSDEEFHDFTAGRREWAPVPFRITDPETDILQYQHVVEALRTGDTSRLYTAGMQLKHNESRAWMDERDPSGLGSYLQMGRVAGSAYSANWGLIERGALIRNGLWGPPPVEFGDIINPSDIILTGVTQIIIGVRPVSDWPQILEEWYAAGGQAMEDAVNLHFGN